MLSFSSSSSRDSWERLVAAVVKRQQIWELCHQQSFSTITTSDYDDDLSEQTLSFSGTSFEQFSVPPSPLYAPENSSIYQVQTTAVINNDSSRSTARSLFSAWYKRKKSKDKDLVDTPAEYSSAYLGQLERFSFRQLQVATDVFNNKNIMGRGRLGNLYKGRLVDGTLITINRLKKEQGTGKVLQFQVEVHMFFIMAVHRNLLRLRGICTTPKELFLVYPYMVNGSIASCLRERPPGVAPLDWKTRKHIAQGLARGLSYLHHQCDPKVIHGKVKASNILLDEEYEAVVGDFSLAKLMNHSDSNVTPEYQSTEITSDKTDVYGYGFTLLELITGQKPFDFPRLAHDDNIMLLDWVKGLLEEKELATLVDPDLKNNYVEEEVEQLIQVSLLCTQTSPLGRPKMSEVVRLLDGDGLAEKWDEWHQVEHGFHPTYNREIVDYTNDLRVVELSGPR